MAKYYNIRWTENDSKQLSKAVKNFNAKVKRLEAKYSDIPDMVLPEKVTMKEMREVIGTRRDLQKELKSLQKFTQRGSEEVVKANTKDTILLTKWQKDELLKREKVINKARAERREELENQGLIHKGEGVGYTRGAVGMGKTDALMLRPTHAFTPKMQKYELKEKMKHFRRESQSDYWNKRDKLMVDNYIKALKENFNYNDVKDVIDKINSQGVEGSKDTILSDPQEFNTAYPPSDEDYERYLKHLKEMWGLPYIKKEEREQQKQSTKKKKSKKRKSSKKKSKKRK